LKKNGKVLIGTSRNMGKQEIVENLLTKAGFKFKVVKEIYKENANSHSGLNFNLIEARLKKYINN